MVSPEEHVRHATAELAKVHTVVEEVLREKTEENKRLCALVEKLSAECDAHQSSLSRAVQQCKRFFHLYEEEHSRAVLLAKEASKKMPSTTAAAPLPEQLEDLMNKFAESESDMSRVKRVNRLLREAQRAMLGRGDDTGSDGSHDSGESREKRPSMRRESTGSSNSLSDHFDVRRGHSRNASSGSDISYSELISSPRSALSPSGSALLSTIRLEPSTTVTMDDLEERSGLEHNPALIEFLARCEDAGCDDKLSMHGTYAVGHMIGKGTLGKVRLGFDTSSKRSVAIKVVDKQILNEKPNLFNNMSKEIAIMKIFRHPNLCQLVDVFQTKTSLHVVLEFMPGGDLFEHILQSPRGFLPPKEALSIFQQIVFGLEHMHSLFACHRDLKPENILLSAEKDVVKLADFGLASVQPENGDVMSTMCGSPHYAAPEIVRGDVYNGMRADIWSCGVILYAMVTGVLPFDEDDMPVLLEKVTQCDYTIPRHLPAQLKNLISRMIVREPEDRISLEEIKKHPWFLSAPIPEGSSMDGNAVALRSRGVTPATSSQPLELFQSIGWKDEKRIRRNLRQPGASLEKTLVQLYSEFSAANAGASQSPGKTPRKRIAVL